ncbi:MAG: universal stress protein [Blastocatellia bacterium]|nr:universal stress protein [Blastocatellia bacterium]
MADIKTILFPTDFSDYSNKAFPYAASLAVGFGAKIICMHVEEFLESDPANPEHSFAALEQFDGTLETERVRIRGHAPYKHILELSREKNCDLIVMATHGRSSLSQFFLGGSIAEDVARFSAIPVFIVKVEPDQPAESYTGRLKEVLFTTDFSEASARAFDYALTFAAKFDAKLFVLHIIDDDSIEFYKTAEIYQDDKLKDRVEEFLREYVNGLPGSELVTSVHVVEGRAESEIVRFAEEHEIDLIAIATRGHSLLEEELLGTTADRVIRHAPCPVMAVRG